jgi:hypothetical protein
VKEVKIIIELTEDGEMIAETKGIKGEACLTELEALMEELAEIESVDKSGEYYQKETAQNTLKLGNRR